MTAIISSLRGGLFRPVQATAEARPDLEESGPAQYRFKDIVDAKNGKKVLYTIEHEVRSMKHPIYLRAAGKPEKFSSRKTIMNYAPGFDAWTWGMPHEESSPHGWTGRSATLVTLI